jgi:hypothetical protein
MSVHIITNRRRPFQHPAQPEPSSGMDGGAQQQHPRQPRPGSAAAAAAAAAAGALPEVHRVELEWRALSCCYSTSGGNSWVLKNVYGDARPSEMQVGFESSRIWGASDRKCSSSPG